MINRLFKRVSALICIAVCCMLAVTISVCAEGSGAIRISYIEDGIEFNIYKITSGTGGEIEDKFKDCNVALTENGGAMALVSYIESNNIEPDMTRYTDSSNVVLFEGLDEGIYLVTSESFVKDGKKYRFMPVLVDVFDEEVDVTGKFEMDDVSGSGGSDYRLAVMKVWSGSDGESEVTVQLLKNGSVYDEVKLNGENNWRYVWTGLDPLQDWNVIETDIADGYKTAIEKDGNVFVIINYYSEESTGTTTETTPETTTVNTTGGGGGSSETPTETTTAETTATEDSGEVTTESNTEVTTKKTSSGHGVTSKKNTEEETSITDEEDSESIDSSYSDESDDSENEDIGLDEDENIYVDEDIYIDEEAEDTDSIMVDLTETDEEEINESSEEEEKIPQTGQLWFPVPVLAFVGIIFILLGICERQRED